LDVGHAAGMLAKAGAGYKAGRVARRDADRFEWKNLIGIGAKFGYFIRTTILMGSLKKRRKAKINKHKRRKKLRLNRHKKRTWQK
jgi:hypothetical protein